MRTQRDKIFEKLKKVKFWHERVKSPSYVKIETKWSFQSRNLKVHWDYR
jgi:hypothetical protein